ncbi:MAG TPA: DUF1552 domain-containing protein, partial [Polyangiaceae bacterium]|nr:DUF1552 domain-containing protein [Polyangiaceae bacterium]
MSARVFGRRELLAAAGATLIVPAFLKRAFGAAQALPPRLVILMQACGTHQQSFWPDANGASVALAPLLGTPLAQKTLVIKGIENRTQGLGNQHDRGFHSLWTGVAPVGTPEDSFGGGPSIDQILKRRLAPSVPFPTLNVGVLAAYVAQKNGHRRSFSYLDKAQQILTQVDPYRLYGKLFPSSSDASPETARRRLAAQQSVLDYAASDLSDLSLRLGSNERKKLEAHTTALREYENRLSATLSGGVAACAPPAALPVGLDVTLEDNVPVLADLMIDLVALALSCNLTNIVTFQLGLCGNQWRYRWIGIDKDSHEEVAHADTPDESNHDAASYMTQISTWAAQRVARLANALDGTLESDGTALDNSLVIWANENGTGFHNLDNLPMVFLGGARGKLKQRGLLDPGTQSHYQLNTSVLR